jgi:hypothetical protein
MPEQPDRKTLSHMRLKDEFWKNFTWKAIKRDGFIAWAHNRTPPVVVALQRWAPFKRGTAVRSDMVVAFSDYCKKILGDYPDWKVEAIAEPCAPPKGKSPSGSGAWKRGFGFIGMLRYLGQMLQVPDEAFCRNEADLALAAHMIFRTVGALHNPSLTDEAADKEGERILKRTQAEYTSMLTMLWEKNPYTVLFATRREGGELRRVGVALQIPMIPSFYKRFRAGEVEDCDLSSEDVLSESKYVLIAGAAENRVELDAGQSAGPRSLAIVSTLLFQTAMMVPALDRKNASPVLVTFEGTPEVRKRAANYGVRSTGTYTRLTEKAISEFAKPNRKELGRHYPVALGQYWALKAILIMYQAATSSQEEEEE